MAILAADDDPAARRARAATSASDGERREYAQRAGASPRVVGHGAGERHARPHAARASSNCRTRSAGAGPSPIPRCRDIGGVVTHLPGCQPSDAVAECCGSATSPYVRAPRRGRPSRRAAQPRRLSFHARLAEKARHRLGGESAVRHPRRQLCDLGYRRHLPRAARRQHAGPGRGQRHHRAGGQQRVRRPRAADAAAVRQQLRPPRRGQPGRHAAGGRCGGGASARGCACPRPGADRGGRDGGRVDPAKSIAAGRGRVRPRAVRAFCCAASA